MSLFQSPACRWYLPVIAFLASLFVGGCATLGSGSASSNVAADLKALQQTTGSDVFRVGDKIIVSLGDIPMGPILAEQTIADDGFITLHLNVRAPAAGRTPAQIQEAVLAEYVPKYYKRMSVNVRSQDRFFYVGGEVKNPSRQPYLGEMSVLKAIRAAGDFTDFANKKRIEIIRADGRKDKVDAVRALKEPKLDLPILPGDQVYVHRRGL